MVIICQKCKKEFKKPRSIIKQGRYEGWCKCCAHNHTHCVHKNQVKHARGRQRQLGINTNKKFLSWGQWIEILATQNNKCAICKKQFRLKLKATIDHIIPLSKGGLLTKENVQALCTKCNRRKMDNVNVLA